MKGVIMAGGRGTRLRPLTCLLPKPMVPLLDRPCMEYTINWLYRHGIRDIAVTTQYMPEVIESYFGDGSWFGVRLRYYEETAPLGTAGSVKHAQDFLDEPFVVVSGDVLTDSDLTAAIRYHQRKQAALTLLLSYAANPLEFGVVRTEADGRISQFVEKPNWGEVISDTVNTGIYIVEPELLNFIPPSIKYDFGRQLFPALLKAEFPIFGYTSDGYWSDIGTMKQYRQSQYDLLDGRVRL